MNVEVCLWGRAQLGMDQAVCVRWTSDGCKDVTCQWSEGLLLRTSIDTEHLRLLSLSPLNTDRETVISEITPQIPHLKSSCASSSKTINDRSSSESMN